MTSLSNTRTHSQTTFSRAAKEKMSAPFSRLLAAEIDGRTQTIRYRQLQLRKLHSVLIANKSEVRNAIIADSGHTTAEADIEFLLAVSELKKHYLSLNLEQSLEEEYSVAKGRDAPGRRVGAGIVYIVPASYTLFYSVISPLSAAIAAGNCVVVEVSLSYQKSPRTYINAIQLPNNLLAVTALLRNWLRETLDQETFAISDSRPEDPDFLSHCVQVLQDGADEPAPPSSVRWVSPSARSVAIVDRTANLDKAASALVTARFSFGGKSPYAPDLVLVNEFALKEFLNAVLRHSTKYLAAQNGSTESQYGARRGDEAKELAEEARRQEGTRIVVSGANGTVLEVKSRYASPLTPFYRDY
jgi:acyl-CoA reductase-like NAD-dependent aldehyde dehydrogenase